jgi:subtilisin family serine protease
MTGDLELSWGLRGRTASDIPVSATWPDRITTDWLYGSGSAAGVKVCVVDSGVERNHPLVGHVHGSYVVAPADDGYRVEETDTGDVCGHGTACAGIIRQVAPGCELYSLRVLGANSSGTGDVLLAGLRWAVRQGFRVINLSLSTTREHFIAQLQELADEAYFRDVAIVASAHNSRVVSFPWRFSSVISVGSHDLPDPGLYLYNPRPPVEFFAHGRDVTVAWPGGSTIRSTGNSFATPRIAGLCALALASHPGLTIAQLKTALYLTAHNVRTQNGDAP